MPILKTCIPNDCVAVILTSDSLKQSDMGVYYFENFDNYFLYFPLRSVESTMYAIIRNSYFTPSLLNELLFIVVAIKHKSKNILEKKASLNSFAIRIVQF